MKKLLDGIRDFHDKLRPAYRERFAKLALGQSPDCLFVACSDSRVVPNLFASTNPGDLFVVRNVGNIVPPSRAGDLLGGHNSVGAAIEFATIALSVRDVVVCGHSSCAAMSAIATGATIDGAPHFDRWLQELGPSYARLERETRIDASLPDPDRLSQAHVLQQLDHLLTYPSISRRVAEGNLRLNAWWFDLAHAEVLAWHTPEGKFVPLVDLHPKD